MTELGDLPAQVLLDAKLVISELVTNSVLHAGLSRGDLIDVALRRDTDHLTVEIDDGDGLHGEAGNHPEPSRPGMGMRILDAVCDHWHAHTGRATATLPL